MPWKETNVMELRVQFIRDWLKRNRTLSELCALYGISRKCGYKWIERYTTEGPDWALDRSHRPHAVHNKTAPEVERALMQMRQRHRSWGARKLLHQVGLAHPYWTLPHESTVCDMLSRNGLITAKPRRRAIGHPGRPSSVLRGANDCWSADFKGQFRTGDGRYCYPLTVTDNYSRYLLGCQALPGTLLQPTVQVFTRLFKEYGLPGRIRTDNGSPFAAHTLGRLSRLSVWWLKLGILPELIEPGRPQQNGRHERMHKTLKDETASPPAANHRAQQRRFNTFRLEYNEVRPHEALDMHTPGQMHQPSARRMPAKLLPMQYPDRFEARLVSGNGGIRWRKQWVNVSSALTGEWVGLEQVSDDQWDVYFGVKKLGRLHERLLRIEDELGRLSRCARPHAEDDDDQA
jgi:transposase InsO family protein